MRAPDLLSLVIASGCCLLRIVRAQADFPPSNITITPSPTTEDDFTITWDGCNNNSLRCIVKNYTLLQLTLQGIYSPVQSGDVNGDIATVSIVEQSSSYEIALAYLTQLSLGSSTLVPTTGTPFEPASVAATSSPAPPIVNPVTSGGGTTDSTPRHIQTSTGSVTGPQTQSPVSAPAPSITASSSAVAPGVSTSGVISTSSDSGGLSTGAKVGIAIGAIGIALIVLIGALLIWRRRRQQQLRALPDGMPYSHDTGSTNRDLMAEKEINVINSPVDTLNNGYSAVPSAPQANNQPQTGSWGPPDEHSATSGATATAAAVPHSDAHRRSYGSGYADSSSPGPEAQSATPPTAAASGSAIQRKPVGATSGGTTQHLREPGMSDEEVARLEEEERRLDEAIAEAERKRQGQS